MKHLLEALLGGLPVDNVPDGLEVLGLTVLVLETGNSLALRLRPQIEDSLVGVLPRIDAQQWPELTNNGVLVLRKYQQPSLRVVVKFVQRRS